MLQKAYEARKAAGGPWLAPAPYTSSSPGAYFAEGVYHLDDVTDDYDGNLRPAGTAPDVGADESGGAPFQPDRFVHPPLAVRLAA